MTQTTTLHTAPLLVIVPTYNEVGNIDHLTTEVFRLLPDVHILFVDDSSSDGTLERIEQAQTSHPGQVFLIKRAAKMGLASATWPVSNGGYRMITHGSVKWMPTYPTAQKTCSN